jgi:hypothetical protein
MTDKLSIINSDIETDLNTNRSDFLAMFIKGLMSITPSLDLTGTVGFLLNISPMLSEVVTSFIPNQKIERAITCLQVLDIKLEHVRQDVLELKLKSAEGTDLLQDGLNQASRAFSEERLEYIACLLKNSLTMDDLDHIGKKKLFSILDSLNDAEIVTLKFNSITSRNQQIEFAEKHSELFTPISLHMGCSQEDIDKAAVRNTYKKKLVELDLLQPVYKKPQKGQVPEFDENTGMLKISGHRITSLGKLLLRYIDIAEPE